MPYSTSRQSMIADLETALGTLKSGFEELRAENDALRAENDALRAEKGGFRITSDEAKTIQAWKLSHEHEHHGDSLELRDLGAIGGAYRYLFLPTSIGVLGQIECSICGREFVFRELD